MKKVLLSLLAVAALVLSCQNYDDEFDALNSKIASLESQVTSLAGLQSAVTGVQSSVSALQTAVAAAQAAAEAASDAAQDASEAAAAASDADAIAALSTSIAAIAADLTALDAAVAGATTEADLDALKAELNTTLAALQALIEANSTEIATIVAANGDLKSELEALGVDVNAVLAQNSTYTGNLSITTAQELAFAKSLGNKVKVIYGDLLVTLSDETVSAADVNEVTKLIETVIGNVRVTSERESLDLSALVNVSGDYVISGWDANDDNLANAGDILLDYAAPYSMPSLVKAKKIYLKDYAAVKAVEATSSEPATPAQDGVTSVDLLGIEATSVTTIGGFSVHSSGGGVHTSGGTISVSTFTEGTASFLTATSVKIGDAVVNSLTVNKATGVELHYDGTLSSLSVTDSNAGTTADPEMLTSVTVKAAAVTGAVAIDAKEGATFSAADLVYAGGALSSDAATNTLTKLQSANGITFSLATSVSLPALKIVGTAATAAKRAAGTAASVADFSAPKATSVSMAELAAADDVDAVLVTALDIRKADVNSIDIEEATDTQDTQIDVKSITTGGIDDYDNVTVVNFHGQDQAFDFTALEAVESMIIIGALPTGSTTPIDVDIDDSNDDLETLDLRGTLGTVTVDTNAPLYANRASTALETVKTQGTIRSITVQNNFDLDTLTLDHTDSSTHNVAPVIIVKNNHNLGSINTAVSSVSELTVTGNGSLETLDFTSITKLPNNFTVGDSTLGTLTIAISDNYTDGTSSDYTDRGYGTTAKTGTATLAKYEGMTGTYTAAAAAVDRAYGQSGLATLKPFLAVVRDAHYTSAGVVKSGGVAEISIDMDYMYSTSATAAAVSTDALSALDLSGVAYADFGKYADLQ